MFGSAILDVLLGLVFLFLGISLAASVATEAIASLLKLRQATLLQGIKALLNDPEFDGLARAIYNHALANPLASGVAVKITDLQVKPSYIKGRNFASALIDVLQGNLPGRPILDVVTEIPNEQLRQTMLMLLSRSTTNIDDFRIEIASWFDGAMERVSGWYKRQTQLISFVAAFAVSAILNADALHLVKILWSQPVLADALAAGVQGSAIPLDEVLARMESSSLIGWTRWAADSRNSPWGFAQMLIGWTIVAASSLFGAPFWFDALQRVAWIRGSGKTTAVEPTSNV